MSSFQTYRTCRECGFNNPPDARKCNKCSQKMINAGPIGRSFDLRWVCPECACINEDGNETCWGCNKTKSELAKDGSGSKWFWFVLIVIFVFWLLSR